MDSDDYFQEDTFDDAVYDQLDVIEASLAPPQSMRSAQAPSMPSTPQRVPPQEPSFYDLTLDLDEEELSRLDRAVEDAYRNRPRPGPSRTVQTTLFGGVLPNQQTPASKLKPRLERVDSNSHNSFSSQPLQKSKIWDQTAFAKTGLKQPKGKGKGKGRACDEDEEEEEPVEFVQFPAPFVSIGPPPPMKLKPDLLEAKHWIYPLNQPKRDYQFNIVKRCLFDNTIVSLPTGLGKTFVAGVVMLNFYRWFPEGKVVFVAPTKPLVAQQIEACHKTCGIPGSDAAELTGNVSKPLREDAWKKKRVFYLTPQTLINDLTTDMCDARDIILLVIDEAHRATGNYAYNQVVRYLMAKNPYFRVLALTATPGSNPDAVQALIDGLHISRIEIRDENSLDLRPYLHHKKIEQHIIQMSEDINLVKEPLAALMSTVLKPLISKGIWYGSTDPVIMHPYTPQARMSNLERDKQWARGPLSKLSSLARAMGYLIEGTTGMCHTYLREISCDQESADGDQRKASKARKLRDDPQFQAVMTALETQRARGFSVHPKMERLKALIVQHFAETLSDDGGPSKDETRVMVFVTYREAVDEIVDALNFERPLIRAHQFIGQGIDKQGKRGLAQKEQLEVIKKFKDGEFNVLVATSIGEEGLDIGEVDLIVCYDAQKTPIRMLQRLGRTGRKRDGVVHVLLSEGREEHNFEKAKVTYKEVQKTIFRGETLEFYTDVERLLPSQVKPSCLEKKMDIEEYVREDGRSILVPRASKRKRNDDVMRNIPEGTSTGFVSVADLILKGTKKRKVVKQKDFDEAGMDDDDDRELESGLMSLLSRRTQSEATQGQDKGQKGSKTKKATLRKTKTLDVTTKVSGKKKKKADLVVSPTFSQKGLDDSDDMDLETSISVHPFVERPKRPPVNEKHAPSKSSSEDELLILSHGAGSPSKTRSRKASASPEPHRSRSVTVKTPSRSVASPMQSPPRRKQFGDTYTDSPGSSLFSPRSSPRNLGVIDLTDSESHHSFPDVDIPPIPPDTSVEDNHNSLAEHLTAGQSADKCHDMSWLVNDDDDDVDIEIVRSSPSAPEPPPLPSADEPAKSNSKSTPKRTGKSTSSRRGEMLPPAELPKHIASPSVSSSPIFQSPELSAPVRLRGRQNAKRPTNRDPLESPSVSKPKRRLYRRGSDTRSPIVCSPKQPARPKKRSRNPLLLPHANPLLDIAAGHSGDEESDGEYEDHYEEDEPESESDRQFLQELPETQVSPSYDQSAMYRQGLFTQAPLGDKAPLFANRPVRNWAFAQGFGFNAGRTHVLSSPRDEGEDDEPDEYAIGSFVVDDDAEISYINDSSEP